MGTLTLPPRFWAKVNQTPTCWLWTASTRNGYGAYFHAGQMTPAHRVAYEHLIGPIPEGLEIDHLCRVRACVNPAHLEPVTHQENQLRGPYIGGKANQTHCIHGHEFTPGNTYIRPNGTRNCLTCITTRTRQRRHTTPRKRKPQWDGN